MAISIICNHLLTSLLAIATAKNEYLTPPVQFVPEGGSALIQCKSVPPPEWYLNESSIMNDRNILFSQNFIVVIRTSDIYFGRYTCRGIDHKKNEFLEDSYLNKLYDENIYYQNVHPVTYKAGIGNPAIFNCFHSGPVMWMRKSQLLSQDWLLDSGYLVLIPEVTLDDGGIYQCLGFKHGNHPFLVESILKVIDDSKIDPLNHLAKVGSRVYIWCKSLKILKWTLNGLPLPIVNVGTSYSSFAVIDRVTPADRGLYECEGTNQEGNNFIAQSRVSVATPKLPKSQFAVKGTSVTIYCESETPVKWKFNNKNIKVREHHNERKRPNVHTITIPSFHRENVGTYTCYGTSRGYDEFTYFYEDTVVRLKGHSESADLGT